MSNNTQATTVFHQGGAIGVTFGNGNSSPDIPNVDSLNADMGSGRLKVNHDGSQSTESFSVSKVNVGQEQLDRRANAQSILETARAPHGGRAGKLAPDTVVMVNGMETSLAVAEQLGYVMRNVSGDYVETSQSPFRGSDQRSDQPQGAQQSGQQSERQGTMDDYFELPPSTLQAVNEVIADVPQHVYEGTLHKAINLGFDSLDYKALADHFGTSEDGARERVGFIAKAYEVHATQALKGTVADPSEALQWLQQEKPKEFARAMTELVFGNRTGNLKALAQQFVRSTNPEDDTLKRAGFDVRTERDGTRTVRIQGQWMTVTSAVKAGYI